MSKPGSSPLWQTQGLGFWPGQQHEEEWANLKAIHSGKLNIGEGSFGVLGSKGGAQ